MLGRCLLWLSLLAAGLVAAREVGAGVSVREEGRKLGVTLSGRSGKCAVDGACFSSLDYGNYETCTFTMGAGGVLNVLSFETESNYDKLTVGGTEYSGTTGPQGVVVSAGEDITWSSDHLSTRAGFEICVGDPCVASSSPSDDGSDGNFYCINGEVGGFLNEGSSSCTCTSCITGFAGPNCATCATGYSGTDCSADPCQATSTPTDDGSDGNFYCINGGDVGGATSSCTCTGCDTGFFGKNCNSIEHVVDGMNGMYNKISAYGNSSMANGDTVVLAVRSYKCSEGTCHSSLSMLAIGEKFGEVKCEENTASCILNGENSRRGMRVAGTGTSTLLLRALSFQDCEAFDGGGVDISVGAIVDFELCVFSNCRAT